MNLCGDYDAAFSAAERARAIFTQLGDELRLSRLEINIGNVFYRQDRFADALACYRRAYDGVIKHGNSEGIAAALSNLSICLISLGQFQEALETHQHAREYCEKHGMPLLVAQADYNIAYLYFLRGEYSQAIDMLRSTRLRCNKIDDRYHSGLCNLDLSELYLELNLGAEAAELARLGFAEFEALQMGYESAKCLAFEAIAMGQQGQAFQSLKLFARAREMFVKEKNQVWPSLIDLYQALVLFNEGRHFEARRLAKAALTFFDSSLLPGKAVLCRLLLARIAQRTSDLATAHKECSIAIEKLKDMQAPMLRHQAYLLMGQMHSHSGNKQDAYECFRSSRESLEMLRSNLRGQELKLAFLKNRLEVYELLVDSCLSGHYGRNSLEEAFGYIEEAKSRTLMDQMLQPVYSSTDESGQSDLVRRMRSLRDELNWYYSLIELEQLRPEHRSPGHIKRLEEQVRARETDLIRVLQESNLSGVNNPEMQASKNVSIDEVRAAITPDTLIVEYFQTGDRILACLLGRERLQILPVTLASRISSALRLLQFQLSKYRLGTEYASAFRDSLIQSTNAHLKTLYDELLAPIRDRMNAKHLLFVPHGALHYVPFHALFDGAAYLGDRFIVSYAPTATIHRLFRERKQPSNAGALLIGVPDEAAPLIAQEIENIRSVLPDARSFVGPEATKECLTREMESAGIIHIASHAIFRPDNPMFSSLQLHDAALNFFDDWTLESMAVKFVVAAFLSGIAYWIAASNFPPEDGSAAANKIDMGKRQQAVFFFAVAIALRVIALPLAPSDDLWRYAWEGKIQRAGLNPYLVAPDDPKLDALRRSFPESSKINYPNVRASYVPGAEILFRLFSGVSDRPLFYKLVFAIVDLATVFLLLRLIGGDDRYRHAAWYAWNPLVAYSFAGAAHFDILMILPLVGGSKGQLFVE